jgi:hypothetical protein
MQFAGETGLSYEGLCKAPGLRPHADAAEA